MIKKLKRRFMLVIIMIFTFLIIGVAVGIIILMVNSQAKESKSILNFAIRDTYVSPDGQPLSEPKATDGHKSDETLKNAPFDKNFFFAHNKENPNSMFRNWITIEFDSENNVINTFHSMNRMPESEHETEAVDELLIPAALEIKASGNESGSISIEGISYRYLAKNGSETHPYSYKIVFLDRSVEISTISRLAATAAVIALIGITAVFILSIFLSRWAVRPIEDAWNRQKEFIANASHELKTPLTVISANTDVILSNPNETVANQKKWFGYIKEETEKMSKLVSSMLYLAREDKDDEEKIVMTEFCMSDVVEGSCLSFEALAFENGKLIESRIDPDIYCCGDKERIAQLTHILIDNAVNHSAENGKITVALHKYKNKVKLTVENNSEPIPEKDLPHIFDRYFRSDKSHSSSGGFGLGLAIAKSIVDKHNGSITASSSPDGITVFCVIL